MIVCGVSFTLRRLSNNRRIGPLEIYPFILLLLIALGVAIFVKEVGSEQGKERPIPDVHNPPL